MARANSIISVDDSIENLLTFTVTGAGSFSLDISKLSAEVTARAMAHGLVQKISDGAAIAKKDQPADSVECAKLKLAQMQNISERLANGEWKASRGDGGGPVAGIIYMAYAEHMKALVADMGKEISEEQLRAAYGKKSRSDQLALRDVPEIATIIERLRLERGPKASAIDTGALLSELGL